MKTVSTLLTQRAALLRQVRLANLAFAYQTLEKFAGRIARARLTGAVTLASPDPGEQRYWASLTALEGSQSVIEEHFADEDVLELSDLMGFLGGRDTLEVTFRLEELAERFLAPLRDELAREGVVLDDAGTPRDAAR